MKYPENRYTFSISEAARACGVSRATILRMEECGFLTPYQVDSDTGYRYYDSQNIAQIGQYQLLQELGLTRKEITDVYFQNIDTNKFLATQKQRLVKLQRLVNVLEMRCTHVNNYKASVIELPEITCYCKTYKGTTVSEAETLAYVTHQTAVKEGYHLLGSEPMFIDMENSVINFYNNENLQSEINLCIPIVPNGIPDPNVKTFPACHVFSMLGYGNYFSLLEFANKFKEELNSRKINPIGFARIIMHVATYVGAHISPDDFCFEYVIPVEST